MRLIPQLKYCMMRKNCKFREINTLTYCIMHPKKNLTLPKALIKVVSKDSLCEKSFTCRVTCYSPHDEHRFSGPRPVKLCSDQEIFQFLFRLIGFIFGV